MKEPAADAVRYLVVCVGDEREALSSLIRDVERICEGKIAVEGCADAAEAFQRISEWYDVGGRVPVVISEQVMTGENGSDFLIRLHGDARFKGIQKVLLSGQGSLREVTRALKSGVVQRRLDTPWSHEELRACLKELITAFLLSDAPEHARRLESLVDATVVCEALSASERERQAMDTQMRDLRRGFLANLLMGTEDVERAMIDGIDRALDHPERRRIPAGTLLLRRGQKINGVSVVVSGEVQLFRSEEGREITLHRNSAGRVIGLLALAHDHIASFDVRALTDIEVIPLSLEQLESAMVGSPPLLSHFVTVLIRSLVTRNLRITELQVKIRKLGYEITEERDNLVGALNQLERAQGRLVESEKMATLGQLSAGIAHELNNPTAAIRRSTTFVFEDVLRLADGCPDGEAMKACLTAAMSAKPKTTRELRAHRAALAGAVGSEPLASRLLGVGIFSKTAYDDWFADVAEIDREHKLAAMEHYYKLGCSLRSISVCTDRVSAIAGSLRSHVRPDTKAMAEIDVLVGLEDTLLIFAYEFREVNIVREYGDIPKITCRVGEINQVWTNLISNALQAMNNEGVLRIESDQPDADHVRVRIIDSGTGVSSEDLERVFGLNYTTKQGPSNFGLGMGLTICRQLVTRGGGTINMESEPGRTCVAVVLPLRCPED